MTRHPFNAAAYDFYIRLMEDHPRRALRIIARHAAEQGRELRGAFIVSRGGWA